MTETVGMIRILALVALVVPGVFFVGLGSLLIKPPSSRAVAGLTILVAILGTGGYFAGKLDALTMMVLLYPTYQLASFRVLHFLFVKLLHRPAQTAAFNFESGIWPDRAFALAVLIISTFGPVFVIAGLLRP